MFILGGGSIDTQLLKWLCNCNFSVLTFGGGQSTINFWSDFATTTFLYSPLEMFILGGGGGWLTLNFWSDFATTTFLYSPLEMFILGGVNRHSTFEVTLQLQLFCTHLWKCSSWGGRSTLNFWSDFATTTFLYSPLEMFILGGGLIDTQLLKWLCNCNFSVLPFGNIHPGGGWGGQSTLNFWSDFATATFLYSPLGGGGSINNQLLKWLCNYNFSVLTFGNVHPGRGVDQHSTFEVTLQLQLFCTHLWKCSSWGGVDQHSTFEVTLQLQLFCTHLWGGRSTINFWSDFATATFLYPPLEMFILGGGGSNDTQLLKWLCKYNFSVLTFGNVHPGGVRSTINFWSDFATTTFLYSPLEMFIMGGGGSIDTQLLKWLCKYNFSVLTFGNVHPGGGGSIDTQLLKWLCNCNFSVLTFGNVHPGGRDWSTLNFWSDFANTTFLYPPLEMFILGGVNWHSTFEVTLQLQLFCTHLWGGSIDNQLLKWLCKYNFSVLTFGNVHPGGVDRHSTFEVTLQLQLFCTHLWKCSSCGGGWLTLNFWSDFATTTFLYSPLEMFILGGSINTQLLKWLCNYNFSVLTFGNVHPGGVSIDTQLLKWLCKYNFSVLPFGNIHPGGVGEVNRHSTFEVTLQLQLFCTHLWGRGVDQQSTFEVTLQLQLFCTHLWKCSSWEGVDRHSTFEVTLQLQLFYTHLWKCSSWGGVNWHSTFEVTLQLQLFCTHLWKCSSWGRDQSPLNFWSDFANTTFCTHLWKCSSGGGGVNWHSTFEVTLQLQLFCTHLWGGQSTINFWSDFATATFLYPPLEMFILGGGSNDTQLLKWLCKYNFSVLTFGNVHPGGVRSTINFWSDFATTTFLYSPLEMFILGGSIDTQLLKWLCNYNFSVLTFGNVHHGGGGFNWHSAFEVTLLIQLFCTHLWKCSSWGWGVNWHSTFEVTLQL